jgi:hypothetical protein
VAIEVRADNKLKAEEEVNGLMSYAFEASNDEGRFKRYSLNTQQTALIEKKVKKAAVG